MAAALVANAAAMAQQPAPSAMSLGEMAAKRFPQPVLVGSLIHRTVLRPIESQPVLGHVADAVRSVDGTVRIVVDYGGFLGIGSRLIAVPADAMTLLGDAMQIVDFTPDQLGRFPTYTGSGATPIALDQTIRIGLARPAH